MPFLPAHGKPLPGATLDHGRSRRPITRCPTASRSSRATSPGSTSTPSSMPPIRALARAAASTAPSTAPPAPSLPRPARARRLRHRRGQDHAGLPACRALRDPHRRAGLGRRRARRGPAARELLPQQPRARREHGLASIAYPAISTGIYGFPPERAARIALRTVLAALEDGEAIVRVVFCCFGRESPETSRSGLGRRNAREGLSPRAQQNDATPIFVWFGLDRCPAYRSNRAGLMTISYKAAASSAYASWPDGASLGLSRPSRQARTRPHPRGESRKHARARPASAFAHPVRLHHLVPHPLSVLHHRACRLAGRARGAVAQDRQGHRFPHRPALDQDLRRVVRHGRGLRRRAVLRVRHQLERAVAPRRQRHRPADVLRGADRLLPRGGLSRHHAVRLQARAEMGAFLRHLHGRARHGDLGLLDPVGQQLDADAGRLPRRRQRRAACRRLVAGDLQPVLPLPLRPHGRRRLSHHRLHRGRHRRLVHPAREERAAWPDHARHGAEPAGLARAAPDRDRRPARAEHARISAGQDRRARSALGDRQGRPADPVRHPRSQGREEPLRDRHAASRQPDPHP